MVPIATLTFLIRQKQADAQALLARNRYAGAVYMMGYAIEIALKYKICRTLRFQQGFPETKAELAMYLAALNAPGLVTIPVSKISEIRHHDLNELLKFSGQEVAIQRSYLEEWSVIVPWHPEQRYQRLHTRRKKALDFIRSAQIIIRQML